MGIVLEEVDEVEPQLLTSAMTAFKTSTKSTYASWQRYFNEGKGSQIELVLEALLSY